MLTHYLRRVAVAALAVLTFSIPAAAHHGTENVATPQAPGADAPTVLLQGYVDQIVVDNVVTGGSRRYPILATDDGRRLVFAGTGVDSLVTGTAIKVSGKENGRALFPDSVQVIATSDSRRTIARAASAASFSGVLRLGHADNFDGSPSEFFFALDGGDGRHKRIQHATMLGELRNGMRVNIDGRVAATGELVPERIAIVALADPSPTNDPIVLAAPVTTNYLVIPVKFPNTDGSYGADPFTAAALNTAVFGASGSVKEYYNEVSYGQQLLSGVVANNGSGGFLQAGVAAPSCSDYTAIGTAAENAAKARGYNVAGYSAILYVFNNVPGCGWSGLAYVGYARAWANNTTSLLVIAHELGHNFGLAHAASLDCGANVIDATTCTSSEYGDPFDVMGNNRAMHFNSAQKAVLNWLPAGTVSTHTAGTATYTLSALETAGGSHYAVKVPVAANRTYWIEYRQPIGFDAGLSSFPNNGAQIRVASPFESLCSGCYDDTEFLDLTPATAAFTDGVLVVGQTYTDATYHIAFNIVSATAGAGGQMTVQVIGGAGTPTTTSLSSSLNPSTSGNGVTFTATVTGVAPTGTVNFMDGSSSISGCSAVALTGSGNTRTAACSTSALTAGTHSMTAAYGGDAGNVASTSGALSQVVKSTTSTILTTSGSPSTVGATVTFTATVTGVAPTGSVNFKDGLSSIAGCSAVALTGSGNTRTAACSTSALAAGTHSMTADYGGDAGNVASTSSALSQVVNPGVSATTTSLASSVNPSTVGATVTFTATVIGVAPTGSVNFKDGPTSITGCSAVALTGSGNTRTAACSTSALAAGTHSMTAAYGGDAGNVASTSSALSQVVKATTSTTLATSGSPSTAGATVTFTATVTGVAPTGSVNFKDGPTSITGCSAVALTGSGNTRTAACSTSALAAGTHSMTAAYGGDAGNVASTSSALSQVVKSTTSTILTTSGSPSTVGATVTFTATVTGVAPTGSVNFKDGLSSIAGCSAVALTGSGNTRTAACSTSALAAGTHSMTAAYGGDAGNVASTSSALSQVVNPGVSATTTSLASSVNPSTVGATVTFTATVIGVAPTGSVNFKDGPTSITGCSAVALTGSGNTRTAACSTSALAAGTHSMTAAYGGDAGNVASTSSALSQVVKSTTSTTLATSGSPSTAGATVTFTATVTGVAPTGSVNFKDGPTSITGCSAVALTGSGNTRTAACSTSALAAGTHSMTAAYGGDAGNVASTSSALSQVVNSIVGTPVNVALATNGGVATASSTYAVGGTLFPASGVINGDRAGRNWSNGGGWNDSTGGVFPDWVQINFNGQKTIDHVIVYTLQDNYASPVEPTDTMNFTQYGITDFQVQGWNGMSWVTLGSITGNNLVKRTVNFATATTDRIRVNVTGAMASYSRITEIEAWTTSGNAVVTNTVLGSSPNPSAVGTSVTFTATVTGVAPTGSVNFKDGPTSITGCSAVALTGSGNTRTAACSTSALAAGTHSIVAAYGGDAGNAASSSSALTQTVNNIAQINVALAANGGVATASSTYAVGGALFPASGVINGDRAGRNWSNGGGWNDSTGGVFPDWVQINFNGQKTIDHVIVYTLQDNYASPVEPADTMNFTQYGITDFQVQGWNGMSWVTLGSITGNNLVKRTVNFATATTDRIRVNVTGAMASYSRITEIEAWGN